MGHAYSFEKKLVILKLNKLQHIPSARYSAEILKESGFPVLVFEYGETSSAPASLEGKIPTRRLARSFKSLPSKLRAAAVFVRTFLYLFGAMKKERPALLLTHGLQEQFLAYLLNKVLGISYVTHVHEIFDVKDVKGLNKVLILLEGMVLRRSSFTIFSSEERSNIFESRYELSRKPLVAFNTPRLRTALKETPKVYSEKEFKGKTVLLYIGGLAPMNACEELVESLIHLASDRVLVLAGWGEEKFLQELRKTSQDLGVADRTKFVGPVKEKWEWIEGADIGLCLYKPLDLRTQFNAGPSNKLFEFISAGVPVVVNQAEDFRAIVERQGLGVSVNPYNPKEIAEGIEKVLSNKVGYKKMGSTSKKLHKSLYHYEKQYAGVLEKFQALMPLEKKKSLKKKVA